jgi:DNA-binding PadR family transcriptional regulator
MALQHAVLALVHERRGYGYDLARRLEERIGPGWRLNASAVYPALDQLERAGLVSGSARERGSRRSPRVVYTASAAADAVLERWWSTTVATPEPVRSELHLRLAFTPGSYREALLGLLDTHARDCGELLVRYAERAPAAPAASAPIDAAVRARLEAELAGLRAVRVALG